MRENSLYKIVQYSAAIFGVDVSIHPLSVAVPQGWRIYILPPVGVHHHHEDE